MARDNADKLKETFQEELKKLRVMEFDAAVHLSTAQVRAYVTFMAPIMERREQFDLWLETLLVLINATAQDAREEGK